MPRDSWIHGWVRSELWNSDRFIDVTSARPSPWIRKGSLSGLLNWRWQVRDAQDKSLTTQRQHLPPEAFARTKSVDLAASTASPLGSTSSRST